jgi:hypothetical protein
MGILLERSSLTPFVNRLFGNGGYRLEMTEFYLIIVLLSLCYGKALGLFNGIIFQ